MNDQTDTQLLRAYAEHRSDPAFAELVRRHVDIVHSAALRMVCDSHLAQDVTQAVFLAFARNAAQLTDRPVLSGWLHRTAQNIAAQTVRTDVRRRVRELEAAAMNELLAAEPDALWEHIAPQLDTALGELSEPDRDALLLRYFERKSASEMATTLGISDEAAQKRVSRAVERLREFFAKRGLTVGASGLVVVISTNAVQAAPVGLAITISTAAALAGKTIATTATATTVKAIAMTTLQKTLVTATVAMLAGIGIYEARQASQLNEQIHALQEKQAPLAQQNQLLQNERDDAANRLARLADEVEIAKGNSSELLRLRGEVAQLRRLYSTANTDTKGGVGEEAPVDKGLRRAQRFPRETWVEVGSATPTDAIQSFLSALISSDTNRVTGLVATNDGSGINLIRLAPGNLGMVSGVWIVNQSLRNDESVHVSALIEHQNTESDGSKEVNSSVVIWILRQSDEGWRIADMLR